LRSNMLPQGLVRKHGANESPDGAFGGESVDYHNLWKRLAPALAHPPRNEELLRFGEIDLAVIKGLRTAGRSSH
jgi:hypothetical protein